MRNFKRFLAMTLTMLMLVSSFSLLTSAKFDDVTDFQNEITILSNLGVIKGKADGSFGFDEAVTRRQTALFMARGTTGKVNDAVNWQSSVNNTPFKDLDAEGDYYGAISYCANLGIVKGKSATEFAPNDNILFQEAVTMAVRALGFGSATMDAGYPYTYYSKAVSLGLDAGIENVSMRDVVSRGVMAKLLYNMLFATNAEGGTIAVKAFGSAVQTTNLVLVAASGKKLVTNISLPAAAGTVAFAEFNNDGTLNLAEGAQLNKVYHFNWNQFAALAYGEGTSEKAADHVGASYSVVTIDGFKTLASVSENASKTFTTADAAGNGTIDGKSYSLVQKWSSIFNIGITNTGADELIQYNTAYVSGMVHGGTAFYGNNWYVVNSNNDILDPNGNILLYYKPDVTQSGVFPFAYKIGNNYYPAYLPADGSRYAGAATVDQINAKATYASDKNDSTITTNINSYSETVAYDDNNDGAYDRAYFTAFTFGRFYTFSKDGNTYYNVTVGGNGNRVSSDNIFDGVARGFKNIALHDRTGGVKDGDYVLWAFDAVNNSLTIKKVYSSFKTGYVSSVDVINKTLTFSNLSVLGGFGGTVETVKYGVPNLPGATATNAGITVSINNDGGGSSSVESLIGISYTMLNKSIKYLVDEDRDNRIVAIVEEATANTPLILTGDFDYTSMLAYGYIRARVIDNTGTAQMITISNINGVPVLNYNLIHGFENMGNLFNGFADLVYGAKQNDGTWLINTNTSKTHTAGPQRDTVLTFHNGIAYQNLSGSGVVNTIPGLNFKADGANLVIIVEDENGYTIAKGIPANGAKLIVSADAEIYANTNGYMYIPEIYTNQGTVSGATFEDGWGWNLSYAYPSGNVNDVIYISSLGLIGGSDYTYLYPGTYFSILSGADNADIGAYITGPVANMIEPGYFYEVVKTMQDGNVILNVVKKLTLDTGFDKVYVKAFSDNHVVITDKHGNNDNYVVGKNVTVYNWAPPSKTKLGQPADGKLYEAYCYTGPAAGNKLVFLVTNKSFTPVVDAGDEYGLTINTTPETYDGSTLRVKYDARINNVQQYRITGDVEVLSIEITYADNPSVTLEGAYSSIEFGYGVPYDGDRDTLRIQDLVTLQEVGGLSIPMPIDPGTIVVDITVEYGGEIFVLSCAAASY